LVLSALTTVVAAVSVTLGTTTQATAINRIECGLRTDLAMVYGHDLGGSGEHGTRTYCWANAGEERWSGAYFLGWMKQLSTGNNRVQWHGDGRWQPAAPIEKWTLYLFPNHPGGVRIDGFRIH
jgi:hypothetical protein